jgi:hypothetical protein
MAKYFRPDELVAARSVVQSEEAAVQAASSLLESIAQR